MNTARKKHNYKTAIIALILLGLLLFIPVVANADTLNDALELLRTSEALANMETGKVSKGVTDNWGANIEYHGIISDALRGFAWVLAKGLNSISNASEGLVDRAMELTGWTGLTEMTSLFGNDWVKYLLAASIAVTGFLYIFSEKKPKILRNLLIGIITLVALPTLLQTGNELLHISKDTILSSAEDSESLSDKMLRSQIVDLGTLAAKKQDGVPYLALRPEDIDKAEDLNNLAVTRKTKDIDINEIVTADLIDAFRQDGNQDPDGQKDIPNVLDESGAKLLESVRAYNAHDVKMTDDGSFPLIGTISIFSSEPYRYNIDYLITYIEQIAICLLYILVTIKTVKLLIEIFFSAIIATFSAPEVASGAKTRAALKNIVDAYLTLCISFFCVRMFASLSEYINKLSAGGSFGSKLVSALLVLIVAFILADGPVVAQKIFGYDAGLTAEGVIIARGLSKMGHATENFGRRTAHGASVIKNATYGRRGADGSRTRTNPFTGTTYTTDRQGTHTTTNRDGSTKSRDAEGNVRTQGATGSYQTDAGRGTTHYRASTGFETTNTPDPKGDGLFDHSVRNTDTGAQTTQLAEGYTVEKDPYGRERVSDGQGNEYFRNPATRAESLERADGVHVETDPFANTTVKDGSGNTRFSNPKTGEEGMRLNDGTRTATDAFHNEHIANNLGERLDRNKRTGEERTRSLSGETTQRRLDGTRISRTKQGTVLQAPSGTTRVRRTNGQVKHIDAVDKADPPPKNS